MHNVYMEWMGSPFTHADVEWLNERMHQQIKVNLREKILK